MCIAILSIFIIGCIVIAWHTHVSATALRFVIYQYRIHYITECSGQCIGWKHLAHTIFGSIAAPNQLEKRNKTTCKHDSHWPSGQLCIIRRFLNIHSMSMCSSASLLLLSVGSVRLRPSTIALVLSLLASKFKMLWAYILVKQYKMHPREYWCIGAQEQ